MSSHKTKTVTVKVEKWGRGLGIKINNAMAGALDITEGSVLTLSVDSDHSELFLKKAEANMDRTFITEKELIADLKKNKGHFDEMATLTSQELDY